MTLKEIKAKFPNGAVICEVCGEAYDSMEVFVETHKPPYEWQGACGHVSLKWKNAPKGE